MKQNLIQQLNDLYDAFIKEGYPIDFKLKDLCEFLIIIDIRKEDMADIMKGCLKARRVAGE